MAKAYGSLTILDLLDTATYIYYADNAEGDNPSASPAGKSYIGIYSGPSIEGGQPEVPPDGTVWSKYSGKGIKEFEITYAKGDDNATAPEGDWYDTIAKVDLQHGEWLWTRSIPIYDDGTKGEPSYSVTYIGSDGKDANSYYIETNYDEILRLNSEGSTVFSPEIFTIKVYEMPIENNEAALEEYVYDLLISTEKGWISLLEEPGVSKGIEMGAEGSLNIENIDTVFVNIKSLALGSENEDIKKILNSDRAIFKFSLFD